MSINVMLDLETLGTTPGCGILSIGATPFGLTLPIEVIENTFYEKLDPASNETVGLITANDTLSWWRQQDVFAYREAFSGTQTVYEALVKFTAYLKILNQIHGDIILWGNGADFDQPILAAAYKQLNLELPWKFYNNRCYRTVKNLFPTIKIPFQGTKHNAIHDAMYQARHIEQIAAAENLVI